jgi:hypothetical protein
MHSAGFTRIELLVVLAIIGFVTLLILPGIQYSRQVQRYRGNWTRIRDFVFATQSNPRGVDYSQLRLPEVAPVDMNERTIIDLCFDAGFVAIFLTVGASIGAIYLKLILRSFNRPDGEAAHPLRADRGLLSLLDRWFCPPSSSSM